MNAIDIVLIIPLLWYLYKGFSKGLVIELATLAGLLAGIYAALHFSNKTAQYLIENLEWTNEYLDIIAFGITFIGVLLLVILLGKILEKVVDIMMLGLFNKIAGAAFSTLKAAFILSVVIYFFNKIDPNKSILKEESRQESLLFAPVESIAPMVFPMLENEQINQTLNGIQEVSVTP